MNNRGGRNSFKRAIREGGLTDARNNPALVSINEPQSTTIVEDEINGKQYIKLLPNRRQDYSDRVQLKKFPGYRLITETNNSTTEPTTTQAPDDGLISPDLNEDVTEFLRILNDVGSRISYFLDENNTVGFNKTKKDIIADKTGSYINLDSISSNIIKGIEELKGFFYDFGRKIAPNGVNPYTNNDCMQLLKKKPDCVPHPPEDNKCCHPSQPINVECKSETYTMGAGIKYEKEPYNPSDLNTFINCLDEITKKSTVRDTTDGYNDFNIKVFQTIITKVKTTKFADDEIDDLNVTRPQPYYNPLHLMIEVLKIDVKLFNILYLLNLHNTSRSPITGVYYGKQRTKINENGYPVLSDTVTSSDINNATIQTIDFIVCLLRLITFVDIDSFNKIVEDHFSILAVGNITNAEGENIVISPSAFNNTQGTTSDENIPCFLYGHLLNFCDAARQAVSIIPLDNFPNSPLYDPSKVANIAYNTTYGLLAVSQMMESLLKSRCFAIVMAMLFPSGTFHSAPNSSSARDFGPRFNYDRVNDKDFQSITRLAIDGIPLDMSKVVPSTSIPNYVPHDDPISINKAVFCTLITAICGISRFLWNSNSPCLRLCDLNDEGAFDPDVPYEIPPEYTTTMEPVPILKLNNKVNGNNRAVRSGKSNAQSKIQSKTQTQSKAQPKTLGDVETVVPPEVDKAPDAQDLFSIEPLIKFLQENTYASVNTENGKIYTYLQAYVSAFATYIRTTYNDRANALSAIAKPAPVNRNLYSMLTRGMQF